MTNAGRGKRVRPIKFRAWVQENGAFDYMTLSEQGVSYVFHGKAAIERGQCWKNGWQQFTGLLDRNGKEIYEGDVVRLLCHDDPKCSDKTAEVKSYGDGWFFFTEETKGRMEEICSIFASSRNDHHEMNKCEVIGNIYQNPELIR